jgi:hypothetical protein
MNVDYVSSFMAKTVLVAAFVVIITVFVILMIYQTEAGVMPIVAAAIIFGVSLLIVAYKAYRNLVALSSVGMKIGYVAYMLALFAVCAFLFTYLSLAFLMIYLFWIILKSLFSSRKSGGNRKFRTTVYHGDGTSDSYEEEAEETGRGILGERFYRGKDSGKEYTEP